MKYSGRILLMMLTVVVIGISSCEKEDQMAIDDQLIQDFIAEHNLDAQKTASGLYYVIDEPGSADHPNLSHEVTMSYVGFLLNGNIFDSGSNVTFPLDNLILGWQEGIPLYGKGGKGLLIVPSYLGYGNRQVGGIPPNSVLAFDISLIDFQ